jgi:hypothetical protein
VVPFRQRSEDADVDCFVLEHGFRETGATTGFQDSVELVYGARLIAHIGQGRTTGDYVNGLICDFTELLGATQHKAALVFHPEFPGSCLCVAQQRLGDIGENDSQRGANTFDCSEGYCAIACAYIEQSHGWLGSRSTQEVIDVLLNF